ncbi:MAG: N-acyl-D-amino-acid deacylase family protein [Chloroflexota bacterium]
MFDLLITGGQVFDGSGGEPYPADVGIAGERIVSIGRLEGARAARVILARGKAVSPGFIDMHSHADLNLLVEPAAAPKVRQGVTTELVGQCGLGPAPTSPATAGAWRQTLTSILGEEPPEWPWCTFGAYLADLQKSRPAINAAALVTHGAIRAAVIGLEDRAPEERELANMGEMAERALDEGAFGMSVGLVYLPCFFADEAELVSLYRRVGRRGGLMDIHVRSQADQVLEALGEALGIAAKAEVPLHISHLCAVGRPNWGKPKRMLAMIDEARARGQDVTFDQHPYEGASTLLTQVLPAWVLAGGGEALASRLREPAVRERIKREIVENPPSADPRMAWQNYVRLVGWENILITYARTPANQRWLGRTVSEIAEARHTEPADVAMDLLVEEEGAVAVVMLGTYGEDDLATIMRHPAQMVGSDDIYTGTPHPRLYGTFPRVLGKFAREDGVLLLAQAVAKMTGVPARRLGLKDRGVLREGACADVVVFDPETVRDRATYTEPRQFPLGIEYVVVNGQIAVDGGEQTAARAGRVLRRA